MKTLARHFYCSLGAVSPRSSAGFNHLSNLLLLKNGLYWLMALTCHKMKVMKEKHTYN